MHIYSFSMPMNRKLFTRQNIDLESYILAYTPMNLSQCVYSCTYITRYMFEHSPMICLHTYIYIYIIYIYIYIHIYIYIYIYV